ncbi:hypothetical protein Btru_020231 [Bulinus truncatus]|nr:hypothetical protein Btru_020231 [Bulinus truncatus]
MDLATIVEEIALEGLDGITLNALWQRLDDSPNFPKGNLDHDAKKFIWQYLSGCMDMEFYTLPEPRAELVIFKYSDYIYKDCSCHLPADTPPDIYPLVPIDDKGIKGNCKHFLTRVNVTASVRDDKGQCLCQLEEVIENWGQSFVIVASQQQRNLVLFGYSFNPSGLSKDVYCTLECIGRGRTEGELSACKYNRGLSRSRTTTSPKTTLFSTIKLLVHFGLVTKQPFTVRYKSSHGISQVRLVHLRRFSHMSSACHRTMVKDISDYLLSKPSHIAELKDVTAAVGTTNKQFKKMRKRYKGYLLSETVPYRKMYPNSQINEWKTKMGTERSIRMVKLLKPYNGNDIMIDDSDDDSGDDEEDSFLSKNGEDDDDDEEEEEKPDEVETDMKKLDKSLENPLYHHSLLSQIVILINQSGEKGMMQSEIKKKLNLSRLRIRYCLQELKKANAYTVVMKSIGKNNIGFLMSLEASEIVKAKREEKMNNDSIIDSMEMGESYTAKETVETTSETLQELDEKIQELNILMTVEQVPLKKQVDMKKGNERKDLRKKCILQYLSEKKAVNSSHILYMAISKHESKIGLKERMCRKSFRKILQELRDEGKLYFINISSKKKPEKSIQQMVVESGIPADGVVVKKVLLSTPLNYMSVKFKNPVPHPAPAVKAKQSGVKKRTPEKDKMDSPSVSSLVTTPLKPGIETDNMISICDILDKYVLSSHAAEVTLNEPESPTVYLDVYDWRRYLPPLIKHNAAILRDMNYSGTCMMGDFILHMPLVIFCSLIKSTVEIPGLQVLLDDPVKKLYPIICIPPSVLVFLLLKRRYRGKIKDNLTMMCHMGLLSFGPLTNNRELEYISIFLHSQAMLLDTRKSLKCYIMTHCPEGEVFDTLRFHFQNMAEMDRYWQDLKRISLLSNMGSISTVDIKGSHGKVSLLDAQKPRPINQIVQEDWLPGDHRGAAGLDSSLFAHRPNNWNNDSSRKNLGVELMVQPSISTDIKKQKPVTNITEVSQEEFPELNTLDAKKETVSKSSKGSNSTQPAQMNNADGLKASKRKSVGGKSKSKRAKADSMSSVPRRRAKKDRIPKPRVRKEKFKRKNIYDSTDKEAKKLLKKMRASFTPLENGMILLFEVSSCLLLPRAAQCVHATFLRDLLHKLLEESKDKTANAIKGKALRLLKDKRFRCYLSCYISQALSDEKIADRLRNLKRPQIFSKEMQKVFTDLFYTLKDKFSCAISHPVYLPSTLSELTEIYTVRTTDHYLYSSFKLADMNVSVTNIQTVVVWELLECFLHLKSPVMGNSLYFTMSKYGDDVVRTAYNLLRKNGIIVKVKRSEKEKQICLSSGTALLNSHKCMLR